MKTEELEIVSREVEEAIEAIKSLHEEGMDALSQAIGHACDYLQKAGQIGQHLLTIKSKCKHGEFEDLIQIRCGLHVRTAQRYISVYRKSLQLDQPSPDHLQLAFGTIDFKPVTDGEKGKSDSSQVLRFIEPLWGYIERKPLGDWKEEDRNQFAADTRKRMELCREAGIAL